MKTHLTAAACNSHLASIGDALYVIGGKWKLRVIVALKDGNKRFNDLQRAITGISPRVLSNELKELELNGFVKRNVFTQTPVIVEYEPTEYADTLEPIMRALSEWGATHKNRIREEMKREKMAVV